MANGRFQPVITPASVEAALDMFIFTTSDTSSLAQPLFALALVDDFLENPYLPSASIARQVALKSILTTLITSEYTRIRAIYNLPAPNSSSTLEQLHAAIQRDGQHDSWELVTLSYLYTRYVRTEVNMTGHDFCVLAAVNERNLLRHRQTALERLTARLIDEECSVRLRHHQRRLIATIPMTDTIPPVGRAAEMQRLLDILAAEQNPCIYVHGAPGTGKTRLISDVVRRLVNEQAFDVLLWLDAPRSVAKLTRLIEQRLVAANSAVTAREIMLSQRVIIVIDSVEALNPPEPGTWDALLTSLNQATVLIAGQVYIPSTVDCIPLHLNPLDRDATGRLVRELAAYQRLETTALDDVIEYTWQTSGGNPAAIKLLLAQLAQDNYDFARSGVLSTLYARVYSDLSPEQQALWQLLAMMSGGVLPENIRALNPMFDEAMQTLIGRSLIEYRHSGHYTLLHTASAFIEQRYSVDTALQDEIARNLAGWFSSENAEWLAEAVLLCPWLHLETGFALNLIQQYWRDGLTHNLTLWNEILQRYADVSDKLLDLRLARVICLRKTGDPETASKLMKTLLAETGRTGAFAIQAEALVEYAALWRMQGEYQKALDILQKAEAVPAHYRSGLQHRLMLEYAQIAIDSENARLAGIYVQKLKDTPASHLLLMELHYLARHYEDCRAAGAAIAEGHEATLLDRAAVHTIIGRSYRAENQLPAAILQFENAANLFDRAGDTFALARAQTNLAALLIETGVYNRAEGLLETAQHTQTRLHDAVGLNVTRVNWQHLHRRRLS